MDTSTEQRKLYFFNPGHEAAILNGSPYYMAPANVAKMQKDLAYLPAWIANPSDYVFLDDPLPKDFQDYLSELNLPQAITPSLLEDIQEKLHLHLWGISPQAIHYFCELKSEYNSKLQLPEWNNKIKELSSRQTAKKCLMEICNKIEDISQSIIPQFYTDLNDIEEVVRSNKHRFLAKAPFSSSGRGLLWLPLGDLTRTERQILHGILKKQGSVSIEKILDKKLDFALEFILSENGEIRFEGYSLFQTNTKGAYTGNYLGKQTDIIESICTLIPSDLLNKVKEHLQLLLKSEFGGIYSGCIGVDMMIYQEGSKYMLHPCLEINVRDNMGLVAINLSERYIAPNSEGNFFIDFGSKDNIIYESHQELTQKYPAIFVDDRVQSGYFSLCPVTPFSRYRAYIIIKEKEGTSI